jgi:hypothetical protein
MEQRRLRLGDILDDYCPRERRVTNHAIVAMIDEDIKQTRCTTCDAEHPYKGARVPKRRKKETPQLSIPTDDSVPAMASVPEPAPDEHLPQPAATVAAAPPAPEPVDLGEPQPPLVEDQPAVDGPVHRPLIRATLPRPEGQKDARPVPDFTVRHSPGRGAGHGNMGGNFRGERMRMRGGNGNGHGGPNGNRSGGTRFHGGSGNRPSGGRQAGRGGAPSGFRNGNGPSGKRGRGPRG